MDQVMPKSLNPLLNTVHDDSQWYMHKDKDFANYYVEAVNKGDKTADSQERKFVIDQVMPKSLNPLLNTVHDDSQWYMLKDKDFANYYVEAVNKGDKTADSQARKFVIDQVMPKSLNPLFNTVHDDSQWYILKDKDFANSYIEAVNKGDKIADSQARKFVIDQVMPKSLNPLLNTVHDDSQWYMFKDKDFANYYVEAVNKGDKTANLQVKTSRKSATARTRCQNANPLLNPIESFLQWNLLKKDDCKPLR